MGPEPGLSPARVFFFSLAAVRLWIAIKLINTGHLKITMPGFYEFRTTADDGARLRLDLNQNGVFDGPITAVGGETLIADNTLHPPVNFFSGPVTLLPGHYAIKHVCLSVVEARPENWRLPKTRVRSFSSAIKLRRTPKMPQASTAFGLSKRSPSPNQLPQ